MSAVLWLKEQLEKFGDQERCVIDWDIFDKLFERAENIESTMIEVFSNGEQTKNIRKHNMIHKLIKTENYLLVVDDSEIKEGDCGYNGNMWKVTHIGKESNESFGLMYAKEYGLDKLGYGKTILTLPKNLKKAIAHLPLNNSPILEGVPLLPPLEDEVEKLVDEYKQIGKDAGLSHREYTLEGIAFKAGYNTAKEKYKYTEEDLVWAIQEAYGHGRDEADDILYHQVEESIRVITKYLQQPKIPVGFECETVSDIPSKEVMGEFDSRHKTTTNSQGQTVLVGTYKYE